MILYDLQPITDTTLRVVRVVAQDQDQDEDLVINWSDGYDQDNAGNDPSQWTPSTLGQATPEQVARYTAYEDEGDQ